METSILKTIREMIGPSASYDVFDTNLITHINSAFARLCELGVGPEQPFRIQDDTAEWTDFMDADQMHPGVKDYIYLKVSLIFDPPASATVANLYKEELEKLEWTLKENARFGY